MHLGRKRTFQVMPGAQWLELLCKPIPDRYEQLVRYVGWYSSRSRGARKAKGACAALTAAEVGVTEVLGEYANRPLPRGPAPSTPICRSLTTPCARHRLKPRSGARSPRSAALLA